MCLDVTAEPSCYEVFYGFLSTSVCDSPQSGSKRWSQPMLGASSQRSHEMCPVHLRAGTVPASGEAALALVRSWRGPTGQSDQQANHGSERLAEFQAVTRPPLPLPVLPGCPLSHRPHAAPQLPCSSSTSALAHPPSLSVRPALCPPDSS